MFDKAKSAVVAQKLLEKGQLDKALKEFEKILSVDPMDLWVRLKVGDICVKLGQKEAAASHYLTVAETYSKNGFNLKAIALYKQALKFDPSNLNIYLRLADLYAQQGLLADSFSQYKFVLSQFEKQGKSLEVLEVFKKMVSIDPSNFSLKFKLIQVQIRLNKIGDAVNEILEISKKDIPLELSKDFINLLEKVETLSENNPDFFEASVNYFLTIKEIPIIEEKLNKLLNIEIRPSRSAKLLMEYYKIIDFSEEGFERIFNLIFKSMNFPQVGESFKEFLLKDFRYKEAFKVTSSLSEELIKKGNREDALKMLNELLTYHPVKEKVYHKLIEIAEAENNRADEINARLCLARIYKEEKRENEFEEEVNKVLEKDPESIEAKKLLSLLKDEEPVEEQTGIIDEEKKELKVSFDDFESLAATNEKIEVKKELAEEEIASIDEKIAEARVYVKYGHLYKAIDILNEICAVDSVNIEALKLLVDIYKVQGNKNQEAESIFKLVKIYDDCGAVKDRDKWLQYLEKFDASQGGLFKEKISQIKESFSSISEQSAEPLEEEEMGLIELDIEGLSETAESEVSFQEEIAEIKEKAEETVLSDSFPSKELEELVLEETCGDEEVSASVEKQAETTDCTALLNEANFYYGQGFYNEAIKLYQKIVQIKPENEIAIQKVAELEVKLKEEADVLEEESLSKQGEAERDEGELFFQDEKLDLNLDEIFETIEEKVEEKKEDAETLFNLGTAYKEMGMLDEAKESLKKSAKDKKWELESTILIGLICMEAGNPSESAAYFLSALKIPNLTPDRIAALNYDLALAYEADLKLDEALNAFQKVLEIDKNFREVQEKLSNLKNKLGK